MSMTLLTARNAPVKREYFYETAEDDPALLEVEDAETDETDRTDVWDDLEQKGESDELDREADEEDEEPTDPALIEAARERLKRKRAKQTGWVGAPSSGHRIALDMLRKAFPNHYYG